MQQVMAGIVLKICIINWDRLQHLYLSCIYNMFIFELLSEIETDFLSKSFINKFRQYIGEKLWEKGQAVLLMGWCRGRISEGLDFKDDAGRLVCVIGIPFPSIAAPEVKLKQKFLNNKVAVE